MKDNPDSFSRHVNIHGLANHSVRLRTDLSALTCNYWQMGDLSASSLRPECKECKLKQSGVIHTGAAFKTRYGDKS